MPRFYSLLYLAHQPQFSSLIKKIRMRHTHPRGSEPGTISIPSIMSPSDRRQALFFKATMESAGLGHLDFESQIVFSSNTEGTTLAKKTLVIPAGVTRANGHYDMPPKQTATLGLMGSVQTWVELFGSVFDAKLFMSEN